MESFQPDSNEMNPAEHKSGEPHFGEADRLEWLEDHGQVGWDSASPDPEVDPSALKAATLFRQIFPTAKDNATETPTSIGRFQILGRLGVGRFGVVWKALDPVNQRTVAIKVIHQSQMYDVACRRRFLRECHLAAKLDHPGIVPIYESGSFDGMPYLVMPVCEGQTLDEWRRDMPQPLPPRIAAELMMKVAQAAAYGHSLGVLHRDLKPGNLMISPQLPGETVPSIRILDFGLAIPLDTTLRDTSGSLVAGTPLYMAPEQAMCETQQIGQATDVFAIGAMLYELLTGIVPFHAESLPAIIERLQCETALPTTRLRKDVPADLDAICLKSIANHPAKRYPAAADLADDLARFLAELPVTARKSSLGHRWLTWCSLRRGQQQLALAAIVINGVIMTWSILAIPTAVRQTEDRGFHWQLWLPIFIPMFLGIVPLHGSLIWLSLQIRKQRNVGRNALIAMTMALLVFCYALAVLIAGAPAVPSPAYASNGFARELAFLLVATGFSLLSLLYFLLWQGAAPPYRQR